MSTLPVAVYTAAQVRELDRHAIETLRIPGYALMSRAGEAALGALAQRWPRRDASPSSAAPGNNGGDGYVLARLARAQGWKSSLSRLAEPARLKGDARARTTIASPPAARVDAWHARLPARARTSSSTRCFGIGLRVRSQALAAGHRTRSTSCDAPVLALDIPSGLDADTGADSASRCAPSER